MQLAMVAFTQSKSAPSPTRTRNPQPRDPKIPGLFQDALPGDRNAFRLDTVALSRRTDGQKHNAGTPTDCVDVLKRDADALSRDLGAQKVNAETQKANADALKDNADALKPDIETLKDNVFTGPQDHNGLICRYLRWNDRNQAQNAQESHSSLLSILRIFAAITPNPQASTPN